MPHGSGRSRRSAATAHLEPELTELVNQAAQILAPLSQKLLVVRPAGFDPIGWMLEEEFVDEETETSGAPSEAVLRSASVSMPGVFLTQLAALRALKLQGLDPAVTAPSAVTGHSQGLVAVEAVKAKGRSDAQLLALAQLLGAAGSLVARRRGLMAVGDRSPMLAVSNADRAQLEAAVAEIAASTDADSAPVVSIRNGRRRFVISGPPAALERVKERCEQITAEQTRERDAKKRGGAVFSPTFEPLAVEIGFHHPAFAEAIELVADWAALCGLDVDTARALAAGVLVEPVDWVEEVTGRGRRPAPSGSSTSARATCSPA